MPIYLWGHPGPSQLVVPFPFLQPSSPAAEVLPIPAFSCLAPSAARIGLDFDSLNIFELTHGPIPAHFDNSELNHCFVMPVLRVVQFEPPEPADELQDWCHVDMPEFGGDWELL